MKGKKEITFFLEVVSLHISWLSPVAHTIVLLNPYSLLPRLATHVMAAAATARMKVPVIAPVIALPAHFPSLI